MGERILRVGNVFLGRNTLDGKPLAQWISLVIKRLKHFVQRLHHQRNSCELPIGFKETVQKVSLVKKVNVYKVGDTVVGRRIISEKKQFLKEIILIGTATETFETVSEKKRSNTIQRVRTDPTKPRLTNLKIKKKLSRMVLLKDLPNQKTEW